MKFVDLLRKLGILRYGAKSGTYTSAKDMPTELFQENVYDAKKDLVHREDIKAAAAALKQGGGRKVFYWVFLVIGVLWLILFLLATRITPLFFADLLLWVGFLILTGRFAYQGRSSYLVISILAVVTLFVSFLLLGAAAPPR